MSADTIETSTKWNLWDPYDWRSWASWRALFATGVIFGLMCGGAGLVAEFVVRDLLGLELGRIAPGGFDFRAFAHDLLAFVVAMSLIIVGYLVWIRGPRIFADQAERRTTTRHAGTAFRGRPPDLWLFLSWCAVTFAVYYVTYVGANLYLIAKANAGLTPGIAPMAFIMGTSSLHAGLRRLGATRRKSDLVRK